MSDSKKMLVYQPNETICLDVRLENETIWLTQNQMGLLFGCTTHNVRLHLENIYSCGELPQEATRKDFFLVRRVGAWQVKRQELSRQIPHNRRQGTVSYRRLAERHRLEMFRLHESCRRRNPQPESAGVSMGRQIDCHGVVKMDSYERNV